MVLELRWRRLTLEILVLAICYTVVLCYRFGNIAPFRRGFFCDDESIRYPNVGQTVSEVQVVVSSYLLGLAVIVLTEYFVSRGPGENDQKCYFICTPAPAWIYYAYNYIVGFMLALAVTMDIKFIIGTHIGRLRPNFIALCQPNIDMSNCVGTEKAYITNYTCMGGSEMDSYARQSFISAHTAVPACVTVFVLIYIHTRWNRQHVYGKLMPAFVSIVLIIGTLFIGMTRISDNMHHSTDVIAGLVLGTMTGSLMARYVCDLERNVHTSNRRSMRAEDSAN